MWNFYGVAVFHTSMVNWREGTSALSICVFCYIWNVFSVVVFHTSMVNWRRGPWYMCILLYVYLLWCSGFPYIYGQLEEGTSALSICAFCYIWNLFSVVVFHTSMVNWRRGPWYMCILLYVQLLWCSSFPYIYGQLEEGTSALSICAFCYMWNLCGVVEFHRIYGQLEEGEGTSDVVVCALFYMWN